MSSSPSPYVTATTLVTTTFSNHHYPLHPTPLPISVYWHLTKYGILKTSVPYSALPISWEWTKSWYVPKILRHCHQWSARLVPGPWRSSRYFTNFINLINLTNHINLTSVTNLIATLISLVGGPWKCSRDITNSIDLVDLTNLINLANLTNLSSFIISLIYGATLIHMIQPVRTLPYIICLRLSTANPNPSPNPINISYHMSTCDYITHATGLICRQHDAVSR